jgi:phosphoglycerate kinase
MKTVKNIDFKGLRALVRVDFNVPLDAQMHITDDTRIRAALPTLRHILENGGSVILMSHLGRPKEGPEDRFSLRHLVSHISELLSAEVLFTSDCIGEEAITMAKNLKAGQVLLLENLRFYKEETKGDTTFASQLAALGDVYVNDAFGTAHRAHASTAVIAEYFKSRCCFGFLMADEVQNLEKVLGNARKPFTAIIGGAKVSSKISIIENLLPRIDNLIIGGGMSYTFIKALGGNTGSSLVEDEYLETAQKVLQQAEHQGVRVLIPRDSLCADKFDNDSNKAVYPSENIPEGWLGLDLGEEAIGHYKACIEESKTILWNGPMGVFEMSSFEKGTREVAYSVVRATECGAYSLVGGGDSVAAINKYHLSEHVSYVSTGGGAMLEYLEGKILPGVAAILAQED